MDAATKRLAATMKIRLCIRLSQALKILFRIAEFYAMDA